jgi:hypothetical protein
MNMQVARWVCLGILLVGCTPKPIVKNESVVPHEPSYKQPCFVDITKESEIQFEHDPGSLGDYSMPQVMGSGAALFDFDGDNDLDLLLISGVRTVTPQKTTGNRLYRQDPNGVFTDVTDSSGISDDGYGMGVAIGDIDNDGDLDVYLTRYGDDKLYENRGNGQFVDITDEAGIANPQWGTAASFVDYDRDGWLDLIVVNYVDFFPGSVCEDGSGRRDYCGPESLKGTVDRLYRNMGKKDDASHVHFQDATIASGIARRIGKGLGVLCRDFDGDGKMDIFVANDGEENTLWVQHENGVFSNEAILRGLALNRYGEAEANMGVAADDFNRDGWSDLFVTHLRDESNSLFHASQFGQFSDQTVASGLAITSLPFTGFGVAAADFDHDGDTDLAVANGGVKRGMPAASKDVDDFWQDYAQRNEFYLNDGAGRFQSLVPLGGSDFARRIEVSRALVKGDIDNDGDIDLLVTNCGGKARLYRNDFPKLGAWLSVTAIDATLNRAAIGAQIQVQVGSKLFVRELNPSSGYLSANDLRVHFGLGETKKYDAIRVFWPDGSMQVEEFPGGAIDQSITIIRRTGRILKGTSQ